MGYSAGLIERYAMILGKSVHYVEHPVAPRAGSDAVAGATVLYVHGNLGSCRWYNRVMDLPDLATIALDLPNFGRSEHIAAHDIATYAEYLTGFISSTVGTPVIVVGHSLGGSVAMAAACGHPELVTALVLVDSAPVEGMVTPPEHFPAIAAYRTDEDLLRAALRTVVPTLQDEGWFDELVADARAMKGDAYVGHAEALGKADHTSVAAQYTGPTLVIRGEQDWLVTQDMADRTARAFDGQVRTFPNVGHSLMVEDPDLFASALATFVSGI